MFSHLTVRDWKMALIAYVIGVPVVTGLILLLAWWLS